jgi:hypothetical protein
MILLQHSTTQHAAAVASVVGRSMPGVSVSWQTAALGMLLAAALLLAARCSVYMYMAAAWCRGVDSLLPSGHEHALFDLYHHQSLRTLRMHKLKKGRLYVQHLPWFACMLSA